VLALQGGGNGESIAYTAALQHTRGRYLITAGDYLQIDPREIGIVLEALDRGSDLVTSWRWPRIDPLLNRLQSGFFNRFLRFVSKVDLHDLNCGFRGLRREVLDEITIYGDQFRFLPIMAAKRGFKLEEVKVRHLEERGKTGFFGFGVYFRRLLDILAVTFLSRFTRKPLRFFGIIGLALLGLGVLLGAPPLIERIFTEAGLQNRPIFLMGVVLISPSCCTRLYVKES
jgi:glycosyltransferase involved in cell wall biosynthesis